MHSHVQRPFILPMSNPTSWRRQSLRICCTGPTARPDRDRQPLRPGQAWGVNHHIGQANNALLYPGLGLGAIVARATPRH